MRSRKTYEYRIYRAQFPMPVKRLYSLFTYYELDVNRMQEAAAYLEGEHDFKSFCQTGAQVESTYAPSIPWKWKSREKMIW